VEDTNDQLYIFEQIITEGLSVRAVEELVRNLKEPKTETAKTGKEKTDSASSEYKDLENHLNTFFNSKVEFKRAYNGSGKIIIPFKSDQDLERLIALFDKINA
jgi:ParB family transcriptional regulator, chromosome partitioning protein